MNRVTGPHQAEVNGKRGGFAGCDTQNCPQRSYCLRSDTQLRYRVTYRRDRDSCSAFVPVEVMNV